MAPDSEEHSPPPRPLVDGRLAIDLLNTTWRVDNEGVDWFDDDESVFAFTASHDHPTPRAALRDTRSALVVARQLIRRIFEAGSLATAEDDLLDVIDQTLRSSRPILDRSKQPTLRITGDQPTNALATEAVVDAIDLVAEKADRLRCCEHDECTLWFLDTSKGGRRRWCSMSTCGNRAKARRHYVRSSTPASSIDATKST